MTDTDDTLATLLAEVDVLIDRWPFKWEHAEKMRLLVHRAYAAGRESGMRAAESGEAYR